MPFFTDRKYKQLFFVAAVFNWVVTVAWSITYPLISPIFGISEVASPIFLHSFLALAFVFGIGYYRASLNLERGREVILLGAIGKYLFFVVTSIYFVLEQINILLWSISFGDFLFASLFVVFLRDKNYSQANTL